MTTKIKGLYKGIKYISHIFVVKERELEIGNPTDVKHVAHIGWDGPSGSAPTWMNEFTAAPEFSSSLGTMSEPISSKPPLLTSFSTTQELGSSMARQASETSRDLPPSDIPKASRKHRRRKVKSTSSPKSSTSTRSSRAGKSKLKLAEADKVVNLQPL